MQIALDAVSRGRTTITIAHRLTTIRDADQIIVLDHGHPVELGSHDELTAAEGRYARLAKAKGSDPYLTPTTTDQALPMS